MNHAGLVPVDQLWLPWHGLGRPANEWRKVRVTCFTNTRGYILRLYPGLAPVILCSRLVLMVCSIDSIRTICVWFAFPLIMLHYILKKSGWYPVCAWCLTDTLTHSPRNWLHWASERARTAHWSELRAGWRTVAACRYGIFASWAEKLVWWLLTETRVPATCPSTGHWR